MRRTPLPRLLVVLAFFLVLLTVVTHSSPASAAPGTQQPAPCLSFPQSGTLTVCDDAQAEFRSAFVRWGVQRLGYPLSPRYVQDGFVTQAFQKGIMQWRADSQSVALVNIFDDLHAGGYDRRLLQQYQTPAPLPDGWDGNASFEEVVERRQALLEGRPALERTYFGVSNSLTFFGLPTSEITDMGNHYAIRLQRAVLQEWKEDVPWARAGEVTVANGGEIARALGAIPGLASGPTATPSDPTEWMTVEALRARTYGGGEIERVEVLGSNSAFTRYLISYPSDGLVIGGFMNVPTGQGPFPVILVNHGFMPRDDYETLTYTTKYADALAREGYLVIHSNYRNHRGSDNGPDGFRVGYAIDVLNLIELAKELPEANSRAIGLWGHSMGGGITLRVLAVNSDVQAAFVYGSMSGDEVETYEWRQQRCASNGNGQCNWSGPPLNPTDDPEFYEQISPINYLNGLEVPIAIHHGEQDETVPYVWSVRLRDELTAQGTPVEFHAYADQPHNFVGAGYDLLLSRTTDFFNRHLR